MDKWYIGIDPGKSGGIAWVDAEGGVYDAVKMPATEADTDELFVSLEAFEYKYAVIEHVHSMPGQGVASSFKFGMNYGMLRAFLIAHRIPFVKVTPSVWQRTLKCLSKGDKNVTKAKAQERFPDMEKITHAIADALLIAEYARGLK